MAGVWTRNYYNIMSAAFLMDTPSTSTATPTDYTPPLRVRTTYGNYVTPFVENGIKYTNADSYADTMLAIDAIGKGNMKYLPYNTNAETLNTSYPTGIQFGSSLTPATYEDYKLGNLIASGLTVASAAGALTHPTSFTDNQYETTRTYTITNSSANTINVGEMGILVRVSTVLVDDISVLVYHDVFDNIIALAPGESFIVSFTRKGEPFNYTPY